jgi:hypothetical protein
MYNDGKPETMEIERGLKEDENAVFHWDSTTAGIYGKNHLLSKKLEK